MGSRLPCGLAAALALEVGCAARNSAARAGEAEGDGTSGPGSSEGGESGFGDEDSESEVGGSDSTGQTSESESGAHFDLPPNVGCADGVAPEAVEDLCFADPVLLDDHSATSVQSVRFNDDELGDIVFTGLEGTFVLVQKEDGEFEEALDLGIAGEGTKVRRVYLNDGNWQDDLVITTTNPDSLVVISSEDQGPTAYPTGGEPVAVFGVQLDDSDNYWDLIVVNAGSGTLSMYRGSEDGTLTPDGEVFVGGRPIDASWSFGGELGDLFWQVAVLDEQQDLVHIVDLWTDPPEVIASYPVPSGSSFALAHAFSDTGPNGVLVGNRLESKLTIYDVKFGWAPSKDEAWPGGPVAYREGWVAGEFTSLVVALRDGDAIGLAPFCSEGCGLWEPMFLIEGIPEPVDLDLLRGWENFSVVVASEFGITLVRSTP